MIGHQLLLSMTFRVPNVFAIVVIACLVAVNYCWDLIMEVGGPNEMRNSFKAYKNALLTSV